MIGLLAIASLNTFAHTILGTPLLKGSIKTKIIVDTLETTCRVKIDKVRNLTFEDSYGNPGYTVQAIITLDASNIERNLSVSFKQNVKFENMHTVGDKIEARDFDFKSESGTETMKIDKEGRIKSVTFNYNAQKTTCSF